MLGKAPGITLLILPALLLVQASAAPPAGMPAPRVYPDVPLFKPQKLALADLPRATGPKRTLFNGQNLDGFEPWLGYRQPMNFISHGDAAPIGRQGIGEVFSVAMVDGKPAIRITGNPQGALLTPDLHDYHLSLEFKWGKPDLASGGNHSGLLYHSYGASGGFMGTWMKSVQFQVKPATTGMMVPVGQELHMTTVLGRTECGDYVYMPGGKRTDVSMPTFVHNPRDAERPTGEWNRLDLYVAGNSAVHVVNGVPVMALSDVTLTESDGVARPLTHGRIQLMSEYGEVYYRDITIEPIDRVPRVVIE